MGLFDIFKKIPTTNEIQENIDFLMIFAINKKSLISSWINQGALRPDLVNIQENKSYDMFLCTIFNDMI